MQYYVGTAASQIVSRMIIFRRAFFLSLCDSFDSYLFFLFFYTPSSEYWQHGLSRRQVLRAGLGKRRESCQARFHASLQRATAQELAVQITPFS